MLGRGRWLLVAIAMTSAGCYDWEGAVRRTAAFDHHCEQSHVTILRDDHAEDRSVQLYVCGHERSYRDVPFHGQHHWVDYTTDLATVSSGTASVVTPPAPRSAPAASHTDCEPSVRAQVDAGAVRVLACVSSASVSIAASWNALGSVTIDVEGAPPGVLECVRTAIGQVICPVGTAAGQVLRTVAR